MRYGCFGRADPVQPPHDLHVLADRVVPEAAGLDHVLSRWNSPNAPEMISSPPIAECETRPARNARRYSTTWKRASRLPGSPPR